MQGTRGIWSAANDMSGAYLNTSECTTKCYSIRPVICLPMEVATSQTSIQYSVTFKDDNGIDLKTIQVYRGAEASYGEINPIKADEGSYSYYFEGWYTEKNGSEKANLKNITEDKIVYAKFSKEFKQGLKINYATTLNGIELNNWRVFFNDKENECTYLIYGDFLPNSIVPEFAGKKVAGNYSIFVDGNAEVQLKNGLSNKAYYDSLLTGILNETMQINLERSEKVWAMGSPGLELWIKSWNKIYTNPYERMKFTRYYNYNHWTRSVAMLGGKSNGFRLNIVDTPGYNNDLYFPSVYGKSGVYGYWLADVPSDSTDNNEQFAILTEGNRFKQWNSG